MGVDGSRGLEKVIPIQVHFKTIVDTVKDCMFGKMAVLSMVTGKMIINIMEHTCMQHQILDDLIEAIGKMVRVMDKVKRDFLMVVYIKVLIWMIINMVKVESLVSMEIHIVACGTKECVMDKVPTLGQMELRTLVNGRTIK